ncbi:hypothetical protein FSHL1_012404 [Fusarium sambucinum]
MKFLSFLCVVATYGNVAMAHPTQDMLPMPHLPPSSWNTHTHCFDPDRHPFKSSRAYTPQAAPPHDLIEHSPADNVMIVQATIEDGYSGLLETLANGHRDYPQKQIRGTISWDPEDLSLRNKTDSEWDKLNKAGVRSVRIHGSYGGSGDDLNWVLKNFVDTTMVRQLPMITTLCTEFSGFLSLLEAGRLHVKTGALHRRSDDVSLMEPVVKSFVKAAPSGVVWGSDWPHVNATAKGLTPAPPLEVDTGKELRLLREWLTNDEWVRVFVVNPTQIFGL